MICCPRRLSAFLAVAFLALGAGVQPTSAQSIELVSPLRSTTVAEGKDFATRELSNPWDFDQRRDIGWEEGFIGESVGVDGGVWTGTSAVSSPYIFPLFSGFKSSLMAEGPSGSKQLPRYGMRHPIEAKKYFLLSYKLRNSKPTAYAVHWNNRTDGTYWPNGTQFGANFDGSFHSEGTFPNTGWNIYLFDMRALSRHFAQFGGSWTGKIHSLRIDPSLAGGAHNRTDIDWVRLVDPSGSPSHWIRWETKNLPRNRRTVVYVDSNDTGYNGTPIAQFTSGTDTGEFVFNTAVLPPGKYYFYVRSFFGSNFSREVRSKYSGYLKIDRAPRGYFISPSEISGEDYALQELGNPWDMKSASDVVNLHPAIGQVGRQFTNPSFFSGIFQALAERPWYHIGNVQSDVQVHLNIGAKRPISPKRYRYLTYRIAADDSAHPSIAAKVQDGWFVRTIFWDRDVLVDGGSLAGHPLFEGWKTYTVDLWATNVERGAVESGVPWQGYGSIPHMRLDPLETSVPTRFYIDDVKLTTENTTSEKEFVLSFAISDDQSDIDVDLGYDTNRTGFNGKLLKRYSSLRSGKYSYVWKTANLTKGKRYYPYVVLRDGRNTRQFYANQSVIAGD